MPKVQRIVYQPFVSEAQTAQAAITNQIDASLDLRPQTIKMVLDKNPAITTHTSNKSPYGYMDWWPTSLYVNCSMKPWDNPDVRWALSSYIDRQQVIDAAYGGASVVSPLPMPQYKPLLPYFDAVKDLLQQYPTNTTDPAKGDALLAKAGWKKNNGMWNDATGQPVRLEILGFDVFADVGPVIAQQLKAHGINATYAQPPDAVDRFVAGEYTGALSGHTGSISDPYDTLALYTSTNPAAPGLHQANLSRWSNAAFDAVAAKVYSTAMTDKQDLIALFREAMTIWLPQLPDIQVDEWFHRIPMNQTYWTNWPTQDNPYVNGAFWHLTFMLILWNLQPTQ
jgi:peptide/nickel transport system substrate-binding protein